jgi:hypothetical protein
MCSCKWKRDSRSHEVAFQNNDCLLWLRFSLNLSVYEGVSKSFWTGRLERELQLYRYFVSQSSEFCRHNSLCCFTTSIHCFERIFRYDSVRKLLDTLSYDFFFYQAFRTSKPTIQNCVASQCFPTRCWMPLLCVPSQQFAHVASLVLFVDRSKVMRVAVEWPILEKFSRVS